MASSLVDSPAVDAQRVYLPLRSGRIVALSLQDGGEVWSVDLPIERGIASDGGRLFTATAGELVAIDGASGKTVWQVRLPGVIAMPAARAGWVIASAGMELLAFRADDGRPVWTSPLGSPAISTATIDGDHAYSSLADGTIVSVRILDGRIAWRSRLPSPCGAVTVAGDRLFTGCEDNFFYALDVETGERRWRWRTGADVMSPAAQDGERVYFASLDTLVRALDFESGSQRWRYGLDARPLDGPVLEDGQLIVAVGRQLRAVDVKSGALAGTFNAPAELAAPAVFPPADASPTAAYAVIVTGAATGDWRVYGLMPGAEPALVPLKEIPGRTLSPESPPVPPAEPRPGA